MRPKHNKSAGSSRRLSAAKRAEPNQGETFMLEIGTIGVKSPERISN